MKIAILKEDGKLLTFTNIEKFSQTWENGRCYIDAQMGSDSEGIVVYEYPQPKSKVITDYFGIPDQSTQERTMKYTPEDFANARFAEHPDGNFAARLNYDRQYPWSHSRDEFTDQSMAEHEWVPVPTKPTITKSGVVKVFEASKSGIGGTRTALTQLGIEIIPDPEPTNTDKLEQLIISAPGNFEGVEAILKRPANVRAWAEYLNNHGVTAPKED